MLASDQFEYLMQEAQATVINSVNEAIVNEAIGTKSSSGGLPLPVLAGAAG